MNCTNASARDDYIVWLHSPDPPETKRDDVLSEVHPDYSASTIKG